MRSSYAANTNAALGGGGRGVDGAYRVAGPVCPSSEGPRLGGLRTAKAKITPRLPPAGEARDPHVAPSGTAGLSGEPAAPRSC